MSEGASLCFALCLSSARAVRVYVLAGKLLLRLVKGPGGEGDASI